MILAGKTLDITLADGSVHRCTITVRDETDFERSERTSLQKICSFDDDTYSVPLYVAVGIIHARLRRDGVDVPADPAEFADMYVDMDVVNEGKATGSDLAPPTGS